MVQWYITTFFQGHLDMAKVIGRYQCRIIFGLNFKCYRSFGHVSGSDICSIWSKCTCQSQLRSRYQYRTLVCIITMGDCGEGQTTQASDVIYFSMNAK